MAATKDIVTLSSLRNNAPLLKAVLKLEGDRKRRTEREINTLLDQSLTRDEHLQAELNLLNILYGE